MKKAAYIIFSFILLLQAGGLLFVYQVQQIRIQLEMRQVMNSMQNVFQKLELSKTDFERGRINAFELSYRGKMYDYKSAEISGDEVEVLAIQDTKEDGILELIKELTGNTGNPSGEFPEQLQKLISLTYLVSGSNQKLIPPETKQTEFPNFCESTLGFFAKLSSPPPELI